MSSRLQGVWDVHRLLRLPFPDLRFGGWRCSDCFGKWTWPWYAEQQPKIKWVY